MRYKASPKLARVRELLEYNSFTGEFKWIANRTSVKAGDSAGCKAKDGYVVIKLDGVVYKAHRLAWLLVYGTWPVNQLDHKNGNRSDNRIGNLRKATQTKNMRNRAIQKNCKYGVLGIRKFARSWSTGIKVNKTWILLGNFPTLEQAIVARKLGEKKYFGEFVRKAG